ncbi:hypothetical protein N2152v2_006642 [Parachlorella kessleri]
MGAENEGGSGLANFRIVMAGNVVKHGSSLPWYSIPFLLSLLGVSLLDHLWHMRHPAAHAAWASSLTVLINLGIICNPLSWGATRDICQSLEATNGDASKGWANFALGLLLASHGMCLAYQGLGRRLPGFWPQAAQQASYGSLVCMRDGLALLVALAVRNNAGMCSQLQLSCPLVRARLQGAASYLQIMALLPAAALLELPWVNSLPLRAQCQAVLLFWQLALGIVLPLSLQLRRCQIVNQWRASASQVMLGMGQDTGGQCTGRLLGRTSEGMGRVGHGPSSNSLGGSGITSVSYRSHTGLQPHVEHRGSGTAWQHAQQNGSARRQSLLRSSALNPHVLTSVAVQLVAVAWVGAVAVTTHTFGEAG